MIKKPSIIFGILAIIILAVFFMFLRAKKVSPPVNVVLPQESPKPAKSAIPTATPIPADSVPITDLNGTKSTNNSGFLSPLTRAADRMTKKKFGLFVTPQNSPVQPEKFRGYHTGTDFEVFPEELNAEVPVKAVCSGKLMLKKIASGYGGVAVENCTLDGSPITVVYGHLKISSITANAGENISAGDTLGILGKGYSTETDGERKHLHLGFHKGAAVSILGYVQNQAELSGWIDPCLYVCNN
jgi:murein DD-endopeptidase MepM/ murein hydrolase activator NlpD